MLFLRVLWDPWGQQEKSAPKAKWYIILSKTYVYFVPNFVETDPVTVCVHVGVTMAARFEESSGERGGGGGGGGRDPELGRDYVETMLQCTARLCV